MTSSPFAYSLTRWIDLFTIRGKPQLKQSKRKRKNPPCTCKFHMQCIGSIICIEWPAGLRSDLKAHAPCSQHATASQPIGLPISPSCAACLFVYLRVYVCVYVCFINCSVRFSFFFFFCFLGLLLTGKKNHCVNPEPLRGQISQVNGQPGCQQTPSWRTSAPSAD